MASLQIKGMNCNHCVMAVTKALKEIEGLEDIAVSLERRKPLSQKPSRLTRT
jgi:copper chaperone